MRKVQKVAAIGKFGIARGPRLGPARVEEG